MPTSTSDGKEVQIIVHVAQDLVGGVLLKEEIHLDPNSANILEYIRVLHVFRIRAVTVETAIDQYV